MSTFGGRHLSLTYEYPLDMLKMQIKLRKMVHLKYGGLPQIEQTDLLIRYPKQLTWKQNEKKNSSSK